ncbi:MAG: YbjQ family protein [Gemmatimonadetes bacterium]|nr:MAG: YbjQ family protein [Gemmatimonadota bacterium]
MIVVTSPDVPGYRTVKVLGLVRGNTIRARHLGKDILAWLRNLAGGEVHEYTKMMAEAREQAIDRMLEEAEALGADAVVAVRFQTAMIQQGAAEMLCYGTAVKLAPLEDEPAQGRLIPAAEDGPA